MVRGEPIVVPAPVDAAAELGVGCMPLPAARAVWPRNMRVIRPGTRRIVSRVCGKHVERRPPVGEHGSVAVQAGAALLQPVLDPWAVAAYAALDVEAQAHTPGRGPLLAGDRIVVA